MADLKSSKVFGDLEVTGKAVVSGEVKLSATPILDSGIIQVGSTAGTSVRLRYDGYIANGNAGTFGSYGKIWNSENDGAGSGLDADLLNGVSSLGFMKTTYLGANVNMNTLVTAGVYRFDAGATNRPSEVGDYGNVFVANGGSDTTLQIISSYSTNVQYTRTGWGSGANWTNWKKTVPYMSTGAPSGGVDGEVWHTYV